MNVLKRLEGLLAEAESKVDNQAVRQLSDMIEFLRPLSQQEVICLIDNKINAKIKDMGF